MTPEQYAQIGGGIVVLLGGPPAVKAGLKWVAGYIERRAKERDKHEDREDDRDNRTQERLWERLDAIEKMYQQRETALAEAHGLYVQTLRVLAKVEVQLAKCEADRDSQDQRIADLEERVPALEQRVPVDLTGKIQTVAGNAARVEVNAEMRRRDSVQFPAVREEKAPK
jgi:organic radical activating enzyme